jgi:DNA-binding MarR family transcriptional regulator
VLRSDVGQRPSAQERVMSFESPSAADPEHLLMVVPEERSASSGSPGQRGSPDHLCAEAVAAVHLTALRRQFELIREFYGDAPPHRSREAFWVALEVAAAHLRGEQIALRDLAGRAKGLLSAPTLSRVVAELEERGLLTSETPPGQARLKVLHPTRRALEILTARARDAFGEFAGIMAAAERRMADAIESAPVDTPTFRHGPG